jgi:hypothetical protein
MATQRLYTIEYVAQILGVSVDLLDELAMTMTPEDGVLRIFNGTDRSVIAFTDIALDDASEQLNDPSIRAEFERLVALNIS